MVSCPFFYSLYTEINSNLYHYVVEMIFHNTRLYYPH